MKLSFGRTTIATARYTLLRLREAVSRMDLVRGMTAEELGIQANGGHGYVSSGDGDLAALLTALGITPSDAVIDIGCGKGGAMLVMARFPFHSVTGIELSAELCEIARKNLRRVGIANAEVINADGAHFDRYDSYSYVYLFNPFPGLIMRSAIDHLEASIERAPRRVTVIYKNPVFHDVLVQHGIFQLVGTHDSKRTPYNLPFYVYSNVLASDTGP